MSETERLNSRIRELEKELKLLKKSDEILSKAEIAAGTGSWELHIDTGKMHSSNGAKLIYGLNSNILDYEIIRKIPLPEYRPMMDQALNGLINEGKPYDINFKIKNASSGKILDIHSTCEFDSARRILFGSIHDITEQKKKDEAKMQYNSDLSALLKITMELLETFEKRATLQKIIESAIRLIGLDTAALYLVNGNTLFLETALPPVPDDFPDSFRKAILNNHPHILKTVTDKEPVLVSDISQEALSEEEKLIVSHRNMQSLLYIPLLVTNKVIGVIILGTLGRKYEFTSREINLCRTLSNIGSLSLENSILFEQLNINILELKSTIANKEITEDRLRLLNRAVEHSPVSIVVTDNEGNIEYVNPKFTELTGYTLLEAAGNTPGILKSGYQSDDFYKKLWQTIKAGKNWLGEIKNKKKNGEYYWESVLISPITDDSGRITHFVGVKEDITEKKAMLESLIEAKEKAEESDRLKTAFLHNISHEIRTPLNAIVGFSTFLNEPDLTEEKRKTFSDIILSSNNQLLSIIDSIMKISHLEAGQVEIARSETDILKVAENLFNQFQPVAKEKHLGFLCDTGNVDQCTTAITDQGKLKQILSNLLDNAFKFTDNGYVKLVCRLSGNFVEFLVEDTGIGIAEEDHEKIFERFYQASKPDTQIYSGTGIGLSICAGYASLLGGSLSVKSSLGKGSVFTLRIPL